MIKIILILCISTAIYAKKGIDIADIIQPSFPFDVSTTKKQFKLTKKEIKNVQRTAKAKLDSNTIRMYTIKQKKDIVGYAVLIVQTIRTKKAALLYIIDTKESIKNIEIIVFNEPSEFKPNKAWKNIFKGKQQKDNLFAGKGIPTISGATLTASALADASRIALAIVKLYR